MTTVAVALKGPASGPLDRQLVIAPLFARVYLEPGQQTAHTFSLNVTRDLWLIDRAYNRVVEPGTFTVWVGGSSADSALTLNGTFVVTS